MEGGTVGRVSRFQGLGFLGRRRVDSVSGLQGLMFLGRREFGIPRDSGVWIGC